MPGGDCNDIAIFFEKVSPLKHPSDHPWKNDSPGLEVLTIHLLMDQFIEQDITTGSPSSPMQDYVSFTIGH